MTHAGEPELYRAFRPRLGLVAAWTTGVLVIGGCLLVLATARGPMGEAPANRISLIAFAVFAGWLLWRLGGVHAVPSPDGLVVRNVLRTYRLAWPQIVSVRFDPADAWVRLDVADGTSRAVMGIQRADGRRGAAEASRLAALVVAHGEPTAPPR